MGDSLFARLGATAATRPLCQPWQSARAYYESGRDIGDEYRYILDRQQARAFPGNMLERPGLLLNPWALRATESDKERLAAGGAYAGRAAQEAKAERSAIAFKAVKDAEVPEGFASRSGSTTNHCSRASIGVRPSRRSSTSQTKLCEAIWFNSSEGPEAIATLRGARS